MFGALLAIVIAAALVSGPPAKAGATDSTNASAARASNLLVFISHLLSPLTHSNGHAVVNPRAIPNNCKPYVSGWVKSE